MPISSGVKVPSGSVKLTFPCPKCHKMWTWKSEIAGKKVKCKCGGVFKVPTDPPSPSKSPPKPDPVKVDLAPPPNAQIAPMTPGVKPPRKDDSLYALAPSEEKPAPVRPKPDPDVEVEEAKPAKKKAVGKIFGAQSRTSRAAAEDEAAEKSTKIKLILAIVLITGGGLFICYQLGLFDKLLKAL
jgi:predicted RNA-binding Zn-ribbon protein involved in translation (DUF1610 family)